MYVSGLLLIACAGIVTCQGEIDECYGTCESTLLDVDAAEVDCSQLTGSSRHTHNRKLRAVHRSRRATDEEILQGNLCTCIKDCKKQQRDGVKSVQGLNCTGECEKGLDTTVKDVSSCPEAVDSTYDGTAEIQAALCKCVGSCKEKQSTGVEELEGKDCVKVCETYLRNTLTDPSSCPAASGSERSRHDRARSQPLLARRRQVRETKANSSNERTFCFCVAACQAAREQQ